MRSSSGPDRRERYFFTSPSVAPASAGGVPVPAALAGVHGAHQHEPGWDRCTAARGPGDLDLAVLQGLAQHLQHLLVELGQLVQKQHAVVGQGDLPRPGIGAAARHAHGGDGVVGGAEGPAESAGAAPGGEAHHRVDLGGLQRLLLRSCPAGWRAGAGPAWTCRNRAGPTMQYIVPARGGNLQGPLYLLLALHLGRSPAGGSRLPARGSSGGAGRWPPPRQVADQLVPHLAPGRRRAPRPGWPRRRCPRGRTGRLTPATLGGQGHGQHPGDGPQLPGEGQLPHKGGRPRSAAAAARPAPGCPPEWAGRRGCPPSAESAGARFTVMRDTGKVNAAVLHRRPHPLPGLLHRGVGQAHHVEGGQAAGQVALGGDEDSRSPPGGPGSARSQSM